MTFAPQPAKTISVIFAATMCVTALILNSLMWTRMNESIRDVRNAMQARIEWERLLSQIKDAETGQRGFLLTGNEDFLEPYHIAKAKLPEIFAALEALSTPALDMTPDVEQVRSLVTRRLDLAAEEVVIRRREGLETAVSAMQSKPGKSLMDDIRHRVNTLINRESNRINDATNSMRKDLWWGFLSVIATGVMSLLAGGVALYLLREAAIQARREERLAAEKRRAEESDHQKSSFLATMSHEIRTPMNAILGFGELLENELTTERARRYLSAMTTGGKSLLQLINDILDLSKIEAGMMPLKPEPMDVRDLGLFVQQLFAQQASGKGITLKVETAEEVPRSLLLDGMRLRQVLINVVGNALKFTERGEVNVRFSLGDKSHTVSRVHLRIEVQDTGPGIPAHQQAEVFTPFVQASTATASHRGTGLGLAIVRKLTELMHGSASLQSEVGVGTTFAFDFHSVEVSARLPQLQSGDEHRVNFDQLRPSKILVADDNETNRDLLLGIFERTHHQVTFAHNGLEAVKAVQSNRPDMVLMDIRMPGMDGNEALNLIRTESRLNLLPVIAVTASSVASESDDLKRRFDGFVRKPFTTAQLFEEMAHFIPKMEAGTATANRAEKEEEQPPPAHLVERWRELSGKLRDLERDVWPSVRDGMVMSEVKAFASGLAESAEIFQYPSLASYARRLDADVDSFSISALEDRLGQFPGCIAHLETRLKTSLS